MKRMNRVIAFSALAALSLTLNPVQAGAYGETTEKSTLTADTKAVSEYQTWKDSTWTGKESIDSGKIVLTPGATEKDLNFCWYSKTKGLAKVKLGKKEELKGVYGGEEAFKSALEYYGYTDETFKEFMKTQVISEIVTEYMTKDVTISDEEVEEYYNTNIANYTTKPSATANHILFKSNNEDKEAADAEALAQANEAKAKIDAGEVSFDELFEQYSGNKAAGVYPISESLGTVAYDQANYDTDFLAGLAALGEGEISAPVKSSFGYHIIKATNVVKESTVKSFDEVKDSIKEKLLNEKKKEVYNTTLEEWKKELKVKTYENKLS